MINKGYGKKKNVLENNNFKEATVLRLVDDPSPVLSK